ncbi:MAG TPA: FeoA family protein [Chitinophagales bacterium]|nr:FeoA family protein [Chitinophagales bacterium]
MKPLHQLVPGEKAFIVDMRNTKLCEKFFELGVFPGDMVEMKENNSANNSVVVTINNHTFNIYRPAAETIITNVVSFQVSLN